MKKFLQIDLIAGAVAMIWAGLSVTVLPELAKIVHWEAASAFGLMAMGRGYLALKAASDGSE